jgi:mono/diheme cytochrome c family protein
MNWRILIPAGFAAYFLFGMAQLAEAADEFSKTAANFKQHCSSCHGVDRLGGLGPALIPENLARLRKPEAEKVIREGRQATQMLGFGDKLAADEIKALVEFAYSPIKPMPAWGEAEIKASRIVSYAPGSLPDKPQFSADPMNLFVVVEPATTMSPYSTATNWNPSIASPAATRCTADRSSRPMGVTFSSPRATAGSPSSTSGTSRWSPRVRAGINTRNVAVSGDGKYLAVANYLPHTLVLLDADLNLTKILHECLDKDRKESSRVSAVYDAAPRRSFVAALKDVKEVWEISYDPKADDIPIGMIHDFKYKEGSSSPASSIRGAPSSTTTLDDFFFTQDYDEVMGASRKPQEAGKRPGGAISTSAQENRRPRTARHAPPRFRYHLEIHAAGRRRAHGDGHAQSQGRPDQHDRHADLENA